jgi:DNA-binding transcriptional LysR family regulator
VSKGATRFVFRSNADFARQAATEQGQGICLLPDALAHSALGLVRLEVGVEHPSRPVYLAFHRDRRDVPGVRVAIEELAAALKVALR